MEAIRRQSGERTRAGSALILTVVLTVLLSLIGVLFVMASRLDEMSTSSIADERALSAGVDSVAGRIGKVLVDDLFGRTRTGKLADGTDDNEGYDAAGNSDRWLASLEPTLFNDGGTPYDVSDDSYFWLQISNIYTPVIWGVRPPEIASKLDKVNLWDRADADGDGVTDSLWVPVPGLEGSKGRDIYAAVRIVDNCAMLNLNTAYGINKNSEGRHLSAVDYTAFLRAYDIDRPERIRAARDPLGNSWSREKYHNEVVMKIENPGPDYSLFDIGDELEIRNRYLLTSRAIAKFERRHLDIEARDADWPAAYSGVAYYTFDLGRGIIGYDLGAGFFPSQVKRNIFDDINNWRNKIYHLNFDDSDPLNTHPFEYDRRHVCTFYSFDRNLLTGEYPVLGPALTSYDGSVRDIFIPKGAVSVNFAIPVWDPADSEYDYEYNNLETRKNILQLLYAMRAYFIAEESLGVQEAAIRSAQFVANMIDFVDNRDPTAEGPFFGGVFGTQENQNPTYINREVVKQLILEASSGVIDIDVEAGLDFGLEADDIVYGYERQPFISEIGTAWNGAAGGCLLFAVELVNPYHGPNGDLELDNWRIKIGDEEYDLDNNFIVPEASSGDLGRLVIRSSSTIPTTGDAIEIANFGLGTVLSNADMVELQRPDPNNAGGYITVDKTGQDQLVPLREDGVQVSKRDDTGWKFADMSSFMDDDLLTLGAENNVDLDSVNYQMPVADNLKPLGTLGDFERVILFGNEAESDDPNSTAKTVTGYMASAAAEGDVRFDVEQRRELLDYICFLNRDEGTLPGRININTATEEVVRAAIPPETKLWDANDLAANIVTYRNMNSYEDIMDLLDVPGFDSLASDPNEQGGDVLIGDDIEERDWILSRVSNVFTVRSDVFTAYILVRLGQDGPERRVIAIFDRSNVDSPLDKPRVISVHPVPAVH